MEPCLSCGEALAEGWLDVLCAGCLDRCYTELADALLKEFLTHFWISRRTPRRLPEGESRWWMRTA
jgi:hypothetical protein